MNSSELTVSNTEFSAITPLFIILAATNNMVLKFKNWRVRSRTRRALGEMKIHTLRDIGLTTGQADEIASKPFWQD